MVRPFRNPTSRPKPAPVLAALAALAAACGDSSPEPQPPPPAAGEAGYAADAPFYASLGIDVERELSLVEARLAARAPAEEGDRAAVGADPISDYETPLPFAARLPLSRLERALLVAYLDDPGDAALPSFLAIHHLPRSLLVPTVPARRGDALKHTILALYFLHRAQDAGATAAWIGPVLRLAQEAVDEVFAAAGPITSDEDHAAHLFYREAFHLNREENRHLALDGLLQDFAGEPRNVYTSFALTAVNLWSGGEAPHDDPATLYHFVLGSYFSLHTMELARALELAWDADPRVPRFRMAATLGGFSLLQRRWLAKLHADDRAVELIDAEHRLWHGIQPAFHSFTFGLPFFDEPERFADGLAAYAAGLPFCQQVPVRTCSDLPRFAFNVAGYLLGYVDFLLKAGERDAALQLLAYRQQPGVAEAFAQWDLGRDAWEHRERNLDAIMARYHDGDPSNDPVNFEMKRRRWGEDTTTCQECHQTQGNARAAAEVEGPQLLPPEGVASIRGWPPVTSAWYGAVAGN
jgi:hypothetical protein